MYFCKQCSLQFFKFDIFKEHVLLLHPNSSRTFEALIRSSKKETLVETTKLDDPNSSSTDNKDNILSDFDRNKLFECKLCELKFGAKCNLLKHKTSVHKGKKPFKCSLCSATFARKEPLYSHISSIMKTKNCLKAGLIIQFL